MILLSKLLAVLLMAPGLAGAIMVVVHAARADGELLVRFMDSLWLLAGSVGALAAGAFLYLLAIVADQQVAMREIMEDEWVRRRRQPAARDAAKPARRPQPGGE